MSEPLQPPTAADAARRPFPRLPLLDRHGRVAGWSLADLAGWNGTSAEPVLEALRDTPRDTGAATRDYLVRCDARELLAGRLDAAAMPGVVLKLRLPATATDEVGEALERVMLRLVAQGASFAFNHAALASVWRRCLQHARFLLLDVAELPVAALQPMIKAAKAQAPGVQLVATGVASAALHDQAMRLGFDLFHGSWFMAQRATSAHPRPGHLAPLELIAALMHEASTAEIEEILKRHPVLSFHLMRFVNSSGLGLSCEITSFRHAVMIVGRERLLRWCCLLVAVDDSSECAALNRLAVVRGRFMERLLPDHGDHAFITGVFSLLDRMTGMDMTRALARLALPSSVADALLGRGGPLSPALSLVTAHERDDEAAVSSTLAHLHLSNEQARAVFHEALEWSAKLMP